MNKINFALALALTLMAAIACDEDKVSYDMTEAARAAMDRLVAMPSRGMGRRYC